jgi:type I restriction enzyme R subunit
MKRFELGRVLNWQQMLAARAKLKLVIEDAFDSGLPRAYTPELYQQKCEAVFAHIEQAYPERDRSVYSLAGLSSPPQQPEHQGQAG